MRSSRARSWPLRSARSSRPSRRAGGLPRRATPPGHGALAWSLGRRRCRIPPRVPHLVDERRALRHEPAADPVQHLCVLLGFGVDGDKTHPGAADRLPGSPHRHTRARAPDADPQSLRQLTGAGASASADRFHITRSPASPSDEILPTHSPLTTRVEIPILSAMPAATACHRRRPQQPP